jgi:hypothetical protein
MKDDRPETVLTHFRDGQGPSVYKVEKMIKSLTFSVSDGLVGGLVAEGVLAGLHDEGKTRVDALLGLLL